MNLRAEYHCLFASSSSRHFVVSCTLLFFWIGEDVCPARDVKPVSCITSLCMFPANLPECGPSPWYPSRAANLSHSSLPAGLRRRCENYRSCSLMMTLFLMVVVNSWVTSLAILACCSCRSAPAAAAVLNSWNSVSCLKSLVVLVHHLGVQRQVQYFSDTDFASAFDSSILRNCGCPFHASLQLALPAHAHQRSALLDAALPKAPSLSESCSLILQFFLFDVNLSSTST